jgi:hypothetical protein
MPSVWTVKHSLENLLCLMIFKITILIMGTRNLFVRIVLLFVFHGFSCVKFVVSYFMYYRSVLVVFL